MAIREYKCPACGLMIEKILQTSLTPPSSISCPRCSEQAEFKSIPSSIGILTDNFSERKIDIVIGKDSERRWADLNNRQEMRDSVRQKTGQSGLSMVGRNEFIPLEEKTKEARTEVISAVIDSGYKADGDTKSDKKILGTD